MLTAIQSAWLKHLTSTEPSDRPRAEAALRAFYPDIVYRPPPKYFFWFDSPERAGWAVRLLGSAHEHLDRGLVERKCSHPDGRLLLESLRVELCDKAGLEWDQLTKVAGMSRTQQTLWNPRRITLHGLDSLDPRAVLKTHPQHSEYKQKVYPLLAGPEKEDEFRRIEDPFHEAILSPSGLGLSLSYNMQSSYTFAKMAQDEEEAVSSGREVPPSIAAAWDLARSAGQCWALEGAVVLLERPIELRFDSEMFLHCDDGEAGAFRDGTKICGV